MNSIGVRLVIPPTGDLLTGFGDSRIYNSANDKLGWVFAPGTVAGAIDLAVRLLEDLEVRSGLEQPFKSDNNLVLVR